MLSTNKAFSEWGEVFPHAACVVTLVDRLIHRAEVISIDGDSYRLKEAKERAVHKCLSQTARQLADGAQHRKARGAAISRRRN